MYINYTHCVFIMNNRKYCYCFRFLARMARNAEGLIFYSRGFFILSFFLRLISEVTKQSQSNLDIYSLMTAICKNLVNSPYLPPQTGGGGKNTFLGEAALWQNGTWYQQSERNLSIYMDSLHAPKFGEVWSRNSREWLVSFCPPLNFRNGIYCQPYCIMLHIKQQANVGTCYVVARAYSLQQNAGWAHAGLCHASIIYYSHIKTLLQSLKWRHFRLVS